MKTDPTKFYLADWQNSEVLAIPFASEEEADAYAENLWREYWWFNEIAVSILSGDDVDNGYKKVKAF